MLTVLSIVVGILGNVLSLHRARGVSRGHAPKRVPRASEAASGETVQSPIRVHFSDVWSQVRFPNMTQGVEEASCVRTLLITRSNSHERALVTSSRGSIGMLLARSKSSLRRNNRQEFWMLKLRTSDRGRDSRPKYESEVLLGR